jgi:alpha-L-fucosidase 2
VHACRKDTKADVEKWAVVRGKLGPLLFDAKTGAILVSEGVPFSHSHRHHSHTLAIHPLGILSMHQSEEARRAVRASVRQLIDLQPSHWTGYSHTWAAALAARAGFPDDAERCLLEFDRAYVTRNGFHVNSNQTVAKLRRYRAFTLEGNFMLMDTVQEMCMQSHGGLLQVFPAIPDSWKEASFKDLRAEGGFVVSAKRADGETSVVEITAKRDSVLKLKDPFGSKQGAWDHACATGRNCVVFELAAGETVHGKRE